MEPVRDLFGLVVFVALIWIVVKAATKSLTTGGTMKFGKGKNAKDIGPATVSYAEKTVSKVAKSAGKTFWKLVKRPFGP